MTDQEILQLTDQIRETAYAVHRFFGPGHFEKVYENAWVNRLSKQGIKIQQQVPITVRDYLTICKVFHSSEYICSQYNLRLLLYYTYFL